MEFTLKDLIYIGVYIVTVTVLFMRDRHRISRVEDSVGNIKNIIYLERGGLNVITRVECEKSQANLRQHSQDAFDQISVLHENITIIMLDRGLKPVPMKPETLTKS